MKKIILLCALGFSVISFGQDSLILKNLEQNRYAINFNESNVGGAGWDSIVKNVDSHQYTLIGEIHFTNEIPKFLQALVSHVDFETFVAEIDPYLSLILEIKLGGTTREELEKWQEKIAGNLSFYSFVEDFKLLKEMKMQDIKILGIDQITALNDAPIYLHLSENAAESHKKKLYLKMATEAFKRLEATAENTKNLPYLMSGEFEKDLMKLRKFDLSSWEKDIIDKLEYSRGIYQSKNGHQKRINLMKNQLMEQYEDNLKNNKTLIRLGANHSMKGESLLTIYDIGNLVHNLAESEFKTSYHLAIFSNSGEAAHPFKGHNNSQVNLPKNLDFISPLIFNDKWTYFDLKSLRKEVEKGEIDLKTEWVRRFIKGYDGLLVISETSAGKHFQEKD